MSPTSFWKKDFLGGDWCDVEDSVSSDPSEVMFRMSPSVFKWLAEFVSVVFEVEIEIGLLKSSVEIADDYI